MLNKKICLKCWKESCVFLHGRWVEWELAFENQWKNNTTFCHEDNGHILTLKQNIRKSPPEYCPYRMEQVVSDVK